MRDEKFQAEKAKRQEQSKRHRELTDEQDAFRIFGSPPLSAGTEDDGKICLAEHYVRFLGKAHPPQVFISLGSERPIDENTLRQAFDRSLNYWARNDCRINHIRPYSTYGTQPLRTSSEPQKRFYHLHSIINTDGEITEDNFPSFIKEIRRAVKGAQKRSSKEKKRKHQETSRKNLEMFPSNVYADWSNLKLNIDIKLITDDGKEAGLYTIIKHTGFKLHPVICSHRKSSCKKIIKEERKGKKVCGKRTCIHNRKPTKTDE